MGKLRKHQKHSKTDRYVCLLSAEFGEHAEHIPDTIQNSPVQNCIYCIIEDKGVTEW